MYTPSTEKLTDIGPHYRRTLRDGRPRDPLTVDKYVTTMDCGTEYVPVLIQQGHVTREGPSFPKVEPDEHADMVQREQHCIDQRVLLHGHCQSWANRIGAETDWSVTIHRGARSVVSVAPASY